jgi:CspA family cold shock protein
MTSAGPFLGNVKSYNEIKGWGFFECNEAFDIYGKDILIPRTSVPPGVTLQRGHRFIFSVAQGNTGPIAVDLSQIFAGHVKSYNPDKGWGFVASMEAFALYGKDIMVLKSDFERAGLPVGHQGQQVEFEITPGKRGPLAVNLHMIGQSRSAKGTCGMPSGGPGSPWGATQPIGGSRGPSQPIGLVRSIPNVRKRSADADMPVSKKRHLHSIQERYTGHIKSFNPVKGWGFVASEAIQAAHGKDVMVLRHELPEDADVGQAVSFSLMQGRNGLLATGLAMHESELDSFPEPLLGPDAMPGSERYAGFIKSFNQHKGWGFIESEEMRSLFGKDIMVLKQDLPDGFAVPGQEVAFQLSEGRNGLLATQLEFL